MKEESRIHIIIEKDIKKKLQMKALKEDITLTDIIKRLLNKWLNKENV